MPSAYFDNFPYIGYSLNLTPQPGEVQWVTDIFRRAAPITNLLKEKKLFYPHIIEDGATPEIVADNYYGSVNYHWVVTLLNGITDPLLQWPKGYADLIRFINDRYGSVASASSGIHHYTMTQSKVDSLGNTSTKTFIIDQTKYDTLTSLVPVVVTFANGSTVTTTTTRAVVDNYTYEVDNNESKRNIILLQDTYLPQIVSELENLTSV